MASGFMASEVVFDEGAEAMAEDVAEVIIEKDGTVGVDVTVGTSGEFILETDVEGLYVIGDGGSDAPDGVEVFDAFLPI